MKSMCSFFLFATIIFTNKVQAVDESEIWPQDLGHQLRLRSGDQWPQDLAHQLRLRRRFIPNDVEIGQWWKDILSQDENYEKRGDIASEFIHPFMRNNKGEDRFVRLMRDPTRFG